MRGWRGRRSRAPLPRRHGPRANSLMSAPEMKARSPAPRTTITRTSSSSPPTAVDLRLPIDATLRHLARCAPAGRLMTIHASGGSRCYQEWGLCGRPSAGRRLNHAPPSIGKPACIPGASPRTVSMAHGIVPDVARPMANPRNQWKNHGRAAEEENKARSGKETRSQGAFANQPFRGLAPKPAAQAGRHLRSPRRKSCRCRRPSRQ